MIFERNIRFPDNPYERQKKFMQTWIGYTLSDIHNVTESIRTHPENNCSWFREARKIERHSRQAIQRYLHGWTLFENTPSPPYKVRRERIQWRAV